MSKPIKKSYGQKYIQVQKMHCTQQMATVLARLGKKLFCHHLSQEGTDSCTSSISILLHYINVLGIHTYLSQSLAIHSGLRYRKIYTPARQRWISLIWCAMCSNKKKQQIIQDLSSEMIFGPCVARTHSIEFQKRGFPHAHIIVWLDRTGKDHHFLPHELDQIICAEIPNEYLMQK